MNPTETKDPVILKAAVLGEEGMDNVGNAMSHTQREMSEFFRESRFADDPEVTLKMMAGKAPERKTALALLDEKLGTPAKREPATGNKDRTGNPPYETAEYIGTRAILEQIYEAKDRGVISPYERQQILGALYKDDVYRSILTSKHASLAADLPRLLSGAMAMPHDLTEIIDQIAIHPEYKKALDKLLGDKFDITKAKSESSNSSVVSELKELKKQKKELDDQLTVGNPNSKVDKLEDARRSKNRYKTITTPGGANVGNLVHTLETAEKDVRDYQLEVNRLTKSWEHQLAVARGHKSNTPEYTTEKNLADNIENDLRNAKTNLVDAQTREASIKRDLTTAEAEFNKINEEVEKLRENQTKLAREIATKEGQIDSPEKRINDQTLIDDVEKMFSEAAVESLNARLQRMEGKYQELIEKRKEEEKEEVDKHFEEQLESRWFMDRPRNRFLFWRFGRREVVVDAHRTEQDYRTLVTDGPEGLVRAMVGHEIEEETRQKYGVMALTPEMDEEVTKKIEELTKEKGGEAVTRLLAQMRRLGHIFTLNDAQEIERAQPGAIYEAIKEDAEFHHKTAELTATGVIEGFATGINTQPAAH